MIQQQHEADRGWILVFGATGRLGRAICEELDARGLPWKAVARDAKKAALLPGGGLNVLLADPLDRRRLPGLMKGASAVISALGKPVSPTATDKPGFEAVDLKGNLGILDAALGAGVSRFVYISAFRAEAYPDLTYFRVHAAFSEVLRRSGLPYGIIRPPALFSVFDEAFALASRGRLAHLGAGTCRTNPIHDRDVARLAVDALNGPSVELDAGGPDVFTRAEINELIGRAAGMKRVPTVPLAVAKAMLPLLKWVNRNLYDKMAFVLAVLQEDVVAPPVGQKHLAAYINSLAGKR